MRDQALRYRSIHTQLMEMVLTLRQTVEDHIMQLTTRPQQQDGQAIREQEALLGRLLFQIISFLPAGAQSFQPPCTSTDSRGDVGGGQPVQTSRQTGQMFYQESDFENTVISYDLSNRGIDISALYDLSFRDYDTYQGNKYHKDKNTLVRMGGYTRGPPSLGFTESCFKNCAFSVIFSPVPWSRCYCPLKVRGWAQES